MTSTNAQTISFAPLSNVAVGTIFSLTATATSGLPVTFASTTTNICSVSAGTVTAFGTGTCSITANQAGNNIYTAATAVTRGFSVVNVTGVATCGPTSNAVLAYVEKAEPSR